MLSQGHVGATLYPYPGQVGPIFGKSGSLEEWEWCHNVIVETDFHLSLLQTSILDIYKVFAPLVCCLKGVWVHPYTVTPTKLALDLGILGSLEEWQWCHNVMFGADIYLKPLHTSIVDNTTCFSHWYAVSRACGCILILLHRPSWPQILGFRITCGVKMMPLCHGSG